MSPMSGHICQRFIAALAVKGRIAIGIDTLGFGMSDPPPSPPAVVDYGHAMQAEITAIGFTNSVDVMGYHFGSMIAADIAVDGADLVRLLYAPHAPISVRCVPS